MLEQDTTQVGSVLVGIKVYEDKQILEALKFFDDYDESFGITSASAGLSNPFTTSVSVQRG